MAFVMEDFVQIMPERIFSGVGQKNIPGNAVINSIKSVTIKLGEESTPNKMKRIPHVYDDRDAIICRRCYRFECACFSSEE